MKPTRRDFSNRASGGGFNKRPGPAEEFVEGRGELRASDNLFDAERARRW